MVVVFHGEAIGAGTRAPLLFVLLGVLRFLSLSSFFPSFLPPRVLSFTEAISFPRKPPVVLLTVRGFFVLPR